MIDRKTEKVLRQAADTIKRLGSVHHSTVHPSRYHRPKDQPMSECGCGTCKLAVAEVENILKHIGENRA